VAADAQLSAGKLIGRRSESEALGQLLAEVLDGTSRVIVLRGEAGVGKSALLRLLSDRAVGCRVARAIGIESEMELGYSGLHQLCSSMLGHLERLPVPQRDALAKVFGLSTGSAPDRFLVGLATLTLLAEVAEQQPMICIVDDAQWLDQASALILGFVGRRLLAERVGLVCAARSGIGDEVLTGLPELSVAGLNDSDARSLLLDNLRGPLDATVRDQIVTESHGNPLALLELSRTLSTADLSGGFGLPDSRPVSGKVERSYAQRFLRLPSDTKLLVLAAAAEPLGDLTLLHHAAQTLDLEMAAAGPAVDAGLVRLDGRVEFSHPLVRSAAYRSAAAEDRRRVHHALAEATDGETDPDRRAWHRARATSGPDEEVAAELERSAARAQARGGLAAAAAFLRRAVGLTVAPARRAERALAAAEVSLQAGEFDAAFGLLATADAGPLDAIQHAQVQLVRAHLAFASRLGGDAPPLLLNAARRVQAFDVTLARETYLVAWGAAGFAGRLAGHEVLHEICRAVKHLPPQVDDPRPLNTLLDGLALLAEDGPAAAAPTLQRAATLLIGIPVEDVVRWGFMAASACLALWDFDGLQAISTRQVQLVREAGALTDLPIHLVAMGMACQWMGDFAGAELVAEAERAAAAAGCPIAPYTVLRLRALQGREADATAAIATVLEHAAAEGQGTAAAYAHWAEAVLHNGLARYADAASAARQATADTIYPFPSMWALPELVEAAARGGDVQLAREALGRLAETTRPPGTDIPLGIEARCRALLSDGPAADDLYREAINRLSRTRARPDLARSHLLYGEWLRRERRRTDAREQLRTAHDMLVAIGMEAFTERARRELTSGFRLGLAKCDLLI
jgi:hypothetical protein